MTSGKPQYRLHVHCVNEGNCIEADDTGVNEVRHITHRRYGTCAPLCLQEEEPEKYASHFANYVEEGVDPADIEDLYKAVSAEGSQRTRQGSCA